MRKLLLLALLLSLSAGLTAQQGWRPGESEVMIHLGNRYESQLLRELRLETEAASPYGNEVRAYVIPEELERLKSSGLQYEITIPDLNRHYKGFWTDQMVPPGYYSYEEIVAIADSLVQAFPSICKKVVYAFTPHYKELAALKISDNVNTDEPEPEILFDGGIHGDEVGGPENMIRYARDLCLGYGNDSLITKLINSREIWIYYMVNPDGRISMSRYNMYGVDINRDGGYMWNAEGYSSAPFSQKETKALRQCFLENQFVIYTNYHSGTEIISYPWSYRPDATRDQAHLHQLASVYADSSGYSGIPYGQGYNIMYPINGSWKDIQYGMYGGVGWSIEISVDKQPAWTEIVPIYLKNKPAMTEMVRRAGYGVEGTVTDSVSGTPLPAIIRVGSYFPVYTDPAVGDYHKYLLPGTYSIRVTANGFKSKTITGVVVPDSGSVVTDIKLVPDTLSYAFRIVSCQIPDNNFSDEGYTPGVLGAPDDTAYSLGKSGFITLDMGDTIHDGPGDDLKVFQGGVTDEGFLCYASKGMDGPWMLLGTANGTASFDLLNGGIENARYIRIRDDGDGVSAGPDVGYDLDAVQMLHQNLRAGFVASDTVIAEGSTISFTDLSEGAPAFRKWLFPGGTPSESTEKDPDSITYDSSGVYDVYLLVSNGLSFSSKLKPGYINVSKPNSIREKEAEARITVHPNPSGGVFNLGIRGMKGGTCSIIALNGATIIEFRITGDHFSKTVDLAGKPAGIYTVQASAGGRNLTTRIIIR